MTMRMILQFGATSTSMRSRKPQTAWQTYFSRVLTNRTALMTKPRAPRAHLALLKLALTSKSYLKILALQGLKKCSL